MTDTPTVKLGTNAPTVRLGGRDWPIPELAVRQLRAVRRPLLDLTEALNAFGANKAGEWVMQLSATQYEQLTEVVYQGLTRAHPLLTLREFLDTPVSDVDMFTAFLVVRRQSGLFVSSEDAEPEKKLQAGADQSVPAENPTGTESS